MKITLELTPDLALKITTEDLISAPVALGMLEYAIMEINADVIISVQERRNKEKKKPKETDHA